MTKPFVHNALCESSQVGAGTRVWAFAHIFAGARVGAVVTRSVPPHAIVVGNLAKITGYVDTADHELTAVRNAAGGGEPANVTTVKGVTLHHLKSVEDMRGSLSVGEGGRDIPFEVPLVLTSQHYDNADYVRDHYDFLKLASTMLGR